VNSWKPKACVTVRPWLRFMVASVDMTEDTVRVSGPAGAIETNAWRTAESVGHLGLSPVRRAAVSLVASNGRLACRHWPPVPGCLNAIVAARDSECAVQRGSWT